MRYFYDTEFIDNGRTIELISIGVAAEDGREYYAISTEFDPEQAGRWVRVTWAESPEAQFNTALEIEAVDADGLMLDIATILTSLRVRIHEMNAKSLPGGRALVTLSFPVHNLTELDTIRGRLRGISGVQEVRRGNH